MTDVASASEGATSEEAHLPPMTTYVFGFYRRAPGRPEIPEGETNRIQAAHMRNIRELTERGDLIFAGPFLDDGDVRGILIFSTDSIERVRGWAAGDDALREGRRLLELHQLFAPKGLRVLPPTCV